MRRTIVTGLGTAFLALGLFAAGGLADDPKAVKLDELVLEQAGLKTDGPALLKFFEQRVLTEADQAQAATWVRQLGARSFREREVATAKLIGRGPIIIELLRASLHDADLEVTKRIELIVAKIQEKDLPPQVHTAAARLIRERKPAGAVEILLQHLPFASHENAAEEARASLAALALEDGKAHPALVAGLKSKSAVVRGAAGEALTRAKAKDHIDAVRALLKDPDPGARLRVATALVAHHDKAAVPVIIDLLPDLPRGQAWQAEDLLYRLADGRQPPTVPLGADKAGKEKCRDSWKAWWLAHGDKVDLAKVQAAPRLLGHTVIVLLDNNQIIELGADNKPRWTISNVVFPLDVQVLPGDRVLVAEYHAHKVTERNIKGDLLWQKRINGPLVAQRLDDGNTFIATDSQLVEYDKDDKEVFAFSFANGERIMKATKLPKGDALCLTTGPRVVRINKEGKEVSSFQVDVGMRLFGGRLYVTPQGRALIPHNSENKVVEYDADGKAVWTLEVDQPVAAVRLPNGNTLVTGMALNAAIEYDRAGKEVWSYKTNTRVTRLRR